MKKLCLRFIIAISFLSIFSGCAHSLTEVEYTRALQGLEVLKKAPDNSITLLLREFTEMDLGRSQECVDRLRDANRAPPDQRYPFTLTAYKHCDLRCSKDIEKNLWMGPGKRLPALLKECDTLTPDPYFVGELSAMRSQFLYIDYLQIRMHLDPFAKAVQNSSSPKVKALWKSYQDLAKVVAEAMVRAAEKERKEREDNERARALEESQEESVDLR